MRKEITLRPYGLCHRCTKFHFLYKLPDRQLCSTCHDEYRDQQAYTELEHKEYFGKSAPN